jgi:hypothetical protein
VWPRTRTCCLTAWKALALCRSICRNSTVAPARRHARWP